MKWQTISLAIVPATAAGVLCGSFGGLQVRRATVRWRSCWIVPPT